MLRILIIMAMRIQKTKILIMNRVLLILVLLNILWLESCNTKYEKYEADWVVRKLTIKGVEKTEEIFFYNFIIDVGGEVAIPPGIGKKFNKSCSLKLYSKNRRDFIELNCANDLGGEYEIKCVDKECCRIFLKSDKVYIELAYNSDLPIGRTRKCPLM